MIKTILGIAALCLVGLIGEARAQTPPFGSGNVNVAMWCLNSGGTAWIPAKDTVNCAGGGGGGGAVTLASGAVAAGAYSVGSFVSGSVLAGAFADGAITTMGTEADAAWTSGSGTLVALLKGIYAKAAAPVVTSIDGGLVTIGTTTDAACSTDNGNCDLVQLQKRTNQNLTTLNTTAGNALAAGTNTIGNVGQVSQYPVGAVAITASPSNGTTGSITATLAHVTGHTVYICGFAARANATTAVDVNLQVTGTITGTLNFLQWIAPVASGIGLTEEIFTPCVPASGINTDIAVVTGAPSTGGAGSVSAWGYSL